jgi:predicted HicB family RNase H-like nuclease
MSQSAEHYSITVRRVSIEGEEFWRATVRELPDMAEFAETREEAIDLALDSIETLKQAAKEEGREFPEPLEEEDEYSGRVTLRLPKFLHREIATQAQMEDVSLNTYIVATLAKRGTPHRWQVGPAAGLGDDFFVRGGAFGLAGYGAYFAQQHAVGVAPVPSFGLIDTSSPTVVQGSAAVAGNFIDHTEEGHAAAPPAALLHFQRHGDRKVRSRA